MPHDVFISYAHQDQATARDLCRRLELAGIPCWIAPRDVLPGVEYAAGIVEAIEGCRLFILILSSASNDSPHVLREVERAVAKGRPVLSFRVEDLTLTKAMEYFLSTHHWFDASSGQPADHLAALTDQIGMLMERTSPSDRDRPPTSVEQSRAPGPEPLPMTDTFVAARTEEEYGGGSEVPTTGLLIWGVLTMWIYTVWTYLGLLDRHMGWRRDDFNRRIEALSPSPRARETLAALTRRGFDPVGWRKWLFSGLYALTLGLITTIVVEIHLHMAYIITETRFYQIVPWEMLGASLTFCVSTLLFLMVVCRRLREHEYQEMLLLRFRLTPDSFVPRPPGPDFVKRWAETNNHIALFLIVAVPMTFSPFIGVLHLSSLIEAKVDPYTATIVWTVVIFVLAAVFHYAGVKLLTNMYNGHLAIEADQLRSAGLDR